MKKNSDRKKRIKKHNEKEDRLKAYLSAKAKAVKDRVERMAKKNHTSQAEKDSWEVKRKKCPYCNEPMEKEPCKLCGYESKPIEKSIEEKPSRHISSKVKMYVWRRDEGKCSECGSKINLEYDHIIPYSKGGSSTARNIQLLCEKCNRTKTDKIE